MPCTERLYPSLLLLCCCLCLLACNAARDNNAHFTTVAQDTAAQTGTAATTRPDTAVPAAADSPVMIEKPAMARPADNGGGAPKPPLATIAPPPVENVPDATLAYSYFDSISEQDTKYIWAQLKLKTSLTDTRTALIAHMEHVMAQPLKASDTNMIKGIIIKGYRYITIKADTGNEFDIRLLDGEERQELDTAGGNIWRWSVQLKKGSRTKQSSITLRIKATDNVNGMPDFEDQQVILIRVQIVHKEHGPGPGSGSRSAGTGLYIGLILLVIAAIVIVILLLRKKGKGKRKDPQIFFSYAWGQERELFVDRLYDSLKADGYKVVRDKVSLGYKGIISAFMDSIGKGEFIVVAISDKYLTSEFCMFELFEIFRNSKMEKEELLKKIYPVCIENLNLKNPQVLEHYLQFWEGREAEWEKMVTENADSISEEQQANYTRVKRIVAYLGSLLDFLSDVNFLDQEKLSEDNFQQIRSAIAQRIKEETA